jgi:hypothetical protein
VAHDAIPIDISASASRCVRGTVLLGGWVIRPSLRAPGRSLLTYYMHVDLGGSVPAWAANMVAKRQPLCIDAIRRLFDESK